MCSLRNAKLCLVMLALVALVQSATVPAAPAGVAPASAAPPHGVVKNSDGVETEFVPLEESETKKLKENDDREPVLEDAKFWHNVGLNQLGKVIEKAKKHKDPSYKRKAKNIIIFVGDGMGLTTITAGRIYKGQYLKHGFGEEEMLSFDEFAHTGLAKTYNVDKQVPDSAGTATAMFSGVKTDYGAVGVDTTRSTTDANKGKLLSMMDWAQAEGKRTGIATTTRITHATPASTYARIYHRDWECDGAVPAESQGIHKDIARQLVENEPGNKFNVILGGGLAGLGSFNTAETRTVNFEGGFEDYCNRTDNRNLTAEWLQLSNGKKGDRVFVQTLDQLKDVDFDETEHLMGLFRNNHITFAISREKEEPSLKEMTEAAIRVLERGDDSKGYVLMVEGGRIDQGHHQNYARAALHEVFEFDMAIQAAVEMTNADDTLIMVTADHSHSVTLNGYPTRGADILGFANKPTDSIVYETITYANGPGYYDHLSADFRDGNSSTVWTPLERFTAQERDSPTYRHMATLPLKDESHGGEDVIVFAHGPGSSLVRGVFEQSYLAYVMSYAGCMGPAKDFDDTCKNYQGNSATVQTVSLLLLASLLLAVLRA